MGTNSSRLTAGDFNHDGITDLAVVRGGAPSSIANSVSVLLSKGDGTFQAAATYSAGDSVAAITTDDFNEDTKLDLAVANENPRGTVSVLLNTCVSAGIDLAIVHSNDTITISWPWPSAGFVFESSTSLTAPDWQGGSETKITNNGRLEVTVSLEQQGRYFRLHKP
jgi:hypothetical protein